MRVIFVQPALPEYRVGFFRLLSSSEEFQIDVWYSNDIAGLKPQDESTFEWAKQLGSISSIMPGLHWQHGALTVPLCRGDVVVISGNPRCLSNIALLVKARLRGAKTVWWGHYWSSTSRSWRHSLRLFLMKASDSVLFYTDREVSEYRSIFKERRIISALNNGVDTAPIQSVRRPYHAASRPRALLFIGRLTSKSRLSLGLEALARPELKGITLHVVGWGDDGPALKSKARGMGLEERVFWHGATTDEASIAQIANMCRLFLYPGEVGLSIVHAMAYGLPAVVHSDRWRHMPEFAVFTDGETGRSFIPDQAVDLSRVIGSVIDDTESLDRWSDNCIRVVEENYTTAKMSERFTALVHQLRDCDVQCA